MKERILVINDDDAIRELTRVVLEAKGYEILEADSGFAGIEQAVRNKPDLILLDIMMPGMDGYETCQQLKTLSKTKDIPVLFFSSLTSPKDKIKGLELGAVDFINNIADRGELIARVQTHLHIRSLTRSLMDSNAQLTQKQKNLDDDLLAAATIQRSFLPPANFQMPSFQVASLWLPANLLAGDIFNIIQCGNGKVVFYMIDVSGHDVPSALVTVSVSQYLHQQNTSSTSFLSPKQMMVELDKQYPLDRFDRYFTVFYIAFDISTGTFLYSSAGHPPAILLSKSKGLKLLDKGGTIIGLDSALPFEELREELSPGDKVILYTDGIPEMKNKESELYGTERLCSLLEKIKNEPVADIVKQIQMSVNAFAQGVVAQDDISILAFEFNGPVK